MYPVNSLNITFNQEPYLKRQPVNSPNITSKYITLISYIYAYTAKETNKNDKQLQYIVYKKTSTCHCS